MKTCIAVVACALTLGGAANLHAQTTLRWKLSPGENLAVAVTQSTKSSVASAGKTTATEIKLEMELLWRILSAENGKFRLEQTIKRLSVSLDAPPAGRVQYDTAQEAKPTGSAKEIAASLAPLLAAKVEITMNELGEVLEAKSTSAAAEPAGASAAASLISKESIQQLLKQPLIVLPKEAVNVDETWPKTSDLTTSLGPVKQATTYKYVGPVEQDGQKLEKIEVKTELKPAAPNMSKLMMKEHKQQGEVLFDLAAGRVFKATQVQTLVTERPYRETQIVVTLQSNQQTTVGPAKEAASP